MLCPACQQEIPDAAKFCGHCGQVLETEPIPTPKPQPPAANPPLAPDPVGIEVPHPEPTPVAPKPEKPPKRRTPLLVGLAILALVALGTVLLLGQDGGNNDTSNSIGVTSATTTTTASPTTTEPPIVATEPVGVQLDLLNEGMTGSCNDDPESLECQANVGAPADEPFHIVHGFDRTAGETVEEIQATTSFELYLDNELLTPDAVLDYNTDTGEPAVSYLYQFSSGLSGEHAIRGVWFENGQTRVLIDLVVDFQS